MQSSISSRHAFWLIFSLCRLHHFQEISQRCFLPYKIQTVGKEVKKGFLCCFFFFFNFVYACSLLLSHPQKLSTSPLAAGTVCANLASAHEPGGSPHPEPSQGWFSTQLLSLAFLVGSFFSLSLGDFYLDLRHLGKSTTFILS